MPPGTPIALATLRVSHGQPRPSDEVFRQAIDRDRALLNLPVANGVLDIAIAGPYPISVGGQDLDEYVVWER
jgi:hypothetical protein